MFALECITKALQSNNVIQVKSKNILLLEESDRLRPLHMHV